MLTPRAKPETLPDMQEKPLFEIVPRKPAVRYGEYLLETLEIAQETALGDLARRAAAEKKEGA